MFKLKEQDWAAHAVNFVLVLVSVILGISTTAAHEKTKTKKEATSLLSQLFDDIQEAKCLIHGTQEYYRISQEAAANAIALWDKPSEISDQLFVNELIKGSQIITPPRTLDIYEPLFGKVELKAINETYFFGEAAGDKKETDIRKELVKLFSYETAVFDYDALVSPYRKAIRSIVPYSVQSTYCQDIDIDRNGVQHGYDVLADKPCPMVRGENLSEVAEVIRSREDILEKLTLYASDLWITHKHLSDYKTNIEIVEKVIAANYSQFSRPKSCPKLLKRKKAI